jgi:phage terminase small subunit
MAKGPKLRKGVERRYELFCRAYLIDLNASNAAIKAGYSKKTAGSKGAQLLKKVMISARIKQLLDVKAEKFDITADNVLAHIANLAKANMLDFVVIGEDGQPDTDFSKLTRDQGYAIQEICVDTTGGTGDGERRQVLRTRFKLAGKEKPLEMLAKYLKLLTDRVEVTGLEGLADLLRQRRTR